MLLGKEHRNAERVDGSISESFVVEAAAAIQPFKVLLVRFPSEEVEITNLEVGEKLAVVVISTVARIQEPLEVSFGMDQFRMSIDEGTRTRPERREGSGVVKYIHVEPVFQVIIFHELKHVVVQVAEEMNLQDQLRYSMWKGETTNIRLHAPVPVEILESRMLVEKTTIPAAHMAIANHPSFPNPYGPKVLEAIHKSPFVNPIRERPVFI